MCNLMVICHINVMLDEKKVNNLDKERRDELEREIKDLKDAIEQVK